MVKFTEKVCKLKKRRDNVALIRFRKSHFFLTKNSNPWFRIKKYILTWNIEAYDYDG